MGVLIAGRVIGGIGGAGTQALVSLLILGSYCHYSRNRHETDCGSRSVSNSRSSVAEKLCKHRGNNGTKPRRPGRRLSG